MNAYVVFGFCVVGFLAAMGLEKWLAKEDRCIHSNMWFGMAFAITAVSSVLWQSWVQTDNVALLFNAPEAEGVNFRVFFTIFAMLYLAVMIACLVAGSRVIQRSSIHDENPKVRYVRFAPVPFIVALILQQLYTVYSVMHKTIN